PYFEPAGMIVAEEAGHVIGYVHAGFGPNEAETDLSTNVGIICAIAVRSKYRRQKIGTELLRRAEAYLQSRGAKEFVAGGRKPRNPFYFGLYGGGYGFLTSDPPAEPFFLHHGYQANESVLVMERVLAKAEPIVDPRFLTLRRRYDVQLLPEAEIPSWWQECVLGQFEPVEFRLMDKLNCMPAARTFVWEMQGTKPGEQAAGILDLNVRPDARRQGLARYLLANTMRYLQEQYFRRVEAQCLESNEAGTALLRSLGFEQVDTGKTYSRAAKS
ncbi:MAG TPA: GNAT family N-acetyltransferase, partial [Gemmataceae bacterium]|nr:GNAT family N-acetyltransferase [Gemmataceae bacterium]